MPSEDCPELDSLRQVVDGSLLTADFKPGQIPQGPKGDPGVSGYEVVTHTATLNINEGGLAVSCPTGKRVLGGVGHQEWSISAGPYVEENGPTPGDAAWAEALATLDGTAIGPVTAYAICG